LYKHHWLNPLNLFNHLSQSLELVEHSRVPLYSFLT
jgi:hypothetical protein